MKNKAEKISELKYDLDYLKDQKAKLIDGIENGNWEGYSENLEVRKKKLKEISAKIALMQTVYDRHYSIAKQLNLI